MIELGLTPPDTLVARKYREIQRRAHQVDDIKEIRSLFYASKPKEQHRKRLSKDVVLETGPEDVVTIRSVRDYFWRLRGLAVAWAKAGNHLADSQVRKSESPIQRPQ